PRYGSCSCARPARAGARKAPRKGRASEAWRKAGMTQKKQRRKPGEGQIDQLRSGRWRARITVGGKRRSLGTCDTEAEARDLLDAAREQLATGEMILDDAMTLAELGELWFEHLRQNGRK